MSHTESFFAAAAKICHDISFASIEALASELGQLRERRGRLFLIGVGGSAANCSHAVNDFRKLCHIEAYTPVDNVAELTARINDEGWETVFVEWLRVSRADRNDAVLILSVGGGDAELGVSVNLVRALDEARARGLSIFGIVGRHGGYTKQVGAAVVVVPPGSESRVTPHAEAFQAVVWHCLVSHPKLQVVKTTWERLGDGAPS